MHCNRPTFLHLSPNYDACMHIICSKPEYFFSHLIGILLHIVSASPGGLALLRQARTPPGSATGRVVAAQFCDELRAAQSLRMFGLLCPARSAVGDAKSEA